MIIPIENDEAYPFEFGVATVLKNKNDSSGYNLIDKKGKQILSMTSATEFSFQEGLSIVTSISEKTNYVNVLGYINTNGDWVISNKKPYKISRDIIKECIFSEGLCLISGKYGYDDAFGYMNKEGKLVIPIKYFQAKKFSNGLAAIQEEFRGFWNYINTKGDIQFPNIKLRTSNTFKEGLALILDSKGDWNSDKKMIDTTGKEIFKINSSYSFIGKIKNLLLIGNNTRGYYLYNMIGTAIKGPLFGCYRKEINNLTPIEINKNGQICIFSRIKDSITGMAVYDKNAMFVGSYPGTIRYKFYEAGYIGLFEDGNKTLQPSFFIDEKGIIYKGK